MKVIISLSAKQTPAAFLKSLPEVPAATVAKLVKDYNTYTPEEDKRLEWPTDKYRPHVFNTGKTRFTTIVEYSAAGAVVTAKRFGIEIVAYTPGVVVKSVHDRSKNVKMIALTFKGSTEALEKLYRAQRRLSGPGM